MLAINSVFDFESETAGVTLESSMGVAEFCLFSGLCNCKISAHLVTVKLGGNCTFNKQTSPNPEVILDCLRHLSILTKLKLYEVCCSVP